MQRDFFLKLSEGLIYDCLPWKVAQLDLCVNRLVKGSHSLCTNEPRMNTERNQ
jgi:hypothetical protein